MDGKMDPKSSEMDGMVHSSGEMTLERKGAMVERACCGDNEPLSNDQIDELKEAFIVYDTDGDGAINSKELGYVLRTLGQNPTETELEDILLDADDDGNGTLDFTEFLFMMEARMKEIDHEAEMMSVFKVYDRDGNGTISADELKYMMMQLSEPLTDAEVDEFIRVADVDNDGQIDFEEFVKCMSVAPT